MTDRIKLKAKYCMKYFVKLKKNLSEKYTGTLQ